MANYTNHTNNKPLSKELIAEIKLRVDKGEPKTQIAKSLGISHSVVRKYTAPLPWRIEDAVRDDVLRRLEMGQSRRSIAKILGVSRKWVSELSPEQGKKSKPVPEHIKIEIVRRVQAGESTSSVARSLGILRETAYAIVKARIDMPDEDTVEEIRKQILNGRNLREVALEFNLPLLVLQRIYGKKDTCVRYTEEQKLEMAKLYSMGLKLKEVTTKLGCTSEIVKKSYLAALNANMVEPRIEIAMEDDRELKRIQRLYPKYEEWRLYAVEWYKVVTGNFAICCSAINRYFEYLVENSLFEHPADFFLRQNAKLIPSYFDTYCSRSDHGAAMNNAVVDFLDWVLLQPEFVDMSDDDEAITLPMFRNPINKVIRSDHKAQRGSESNKKVMPYWMICDLRNRLAQGQNFGDWTWAQTMSGKMTLSGDKESRDWFVVSENQIDVNDLDCVTRIRTRMDFESVLEMWSPVRWVACLLKLQTTARTGQIRMLDSGEADTFVYESGTFVLNRSPLATGTIRHPRKQGVIRESNEKTLCLYFNTNKTADMYKLGPEKGMECPWPEFPEHQDNPYYWIEKLRNWQAKYNPVESPIAWKDVPSARRLKGKSDIVCTTYPDAVFLFRTAETEGSKQFPVSSGTIDHTWQQIIAEYESILSREGKRNPDNSQIKLVENGRSEVSLHGLRVSLITHLILDGGVPPVLMMKIVGHLRFIMTIYYTKPGLKRIEDALVDATKILDVTKDEALVRDLTSKSAEQIRNHVVFNSKELIDVIPLNPTDRNPMGWLPMHDGICLAGGNTGPVSGDSRFPGCHNGGALIDEPKKIYGPVPGGVRNCCRCRWKCAGKHHLLGLQATLNNRQYHLYKASSSAIDAERKRNDLLQQKARSESSNQPFVRMADLRVAERLYEAAMHKMQEMALDLAAIHRMIERIKDLPDHTDGPTALASLGDVLTLHTVLDETDSELLVLAGICADVEFYPDLDPGTAIFEYAALLDKAFEREGKPLIFSRMSESEKLMAANAVMRELERIANPDNSILARRKVVETIDRGESLEKVLGVNLNSVMKLANKNVTNSVSIRLVTNKPEGT